MKLVNQFNWSISAANEFDECRRKRYWAKYEAWGGWERDASARRKAAYRLNKMDSLATLLGRAAEKGVVHLIRTHWAGAPLSAEAAYAEVVRPMLNACWKQSKQGDWQRDPKRCCCLFEHYYGKPTPEEEKRWTEGLRERALLCLQHFIDDILPRFAEIQAVNEVCVSTPETPGDSEHILLDSLPGFVLQAPLKAYTIPDFVYEINGETHIRDWKSGRMRDAYGRQLRMYGLWACRARKAVPGQIFLHIDYLMSGETRSAVYTAEDVESTLLDISLSVTDMADYLDDGDLVRNKALPCEEWELCAEREICARCRFFELCRPELDG